MGHSSTCRSNTEDDPWLAVDLGAPHVIQGVAIYNRVGCCQDRLGAFELWVGPSLDNRTEQKCASATAAATVGPFLVECQATARVVTILLPGASRVLSLAEVKVYSTFKPPPPSLPPMPPGQGSNYNSETGCTVESVDYKPVDSLGSLGVLPAGPWSVLLVDAAADSPTPEDMTGELLSVDICVQEPAAELSSGALQMLNVGQNTSQEMLAPLCSCMYSVHALEMVESVTCLIGSGTPANWWSNCCSQVNDTRY